MSGGGGSPVQGSTFNSPLLSSLPSALNLAQGHIGSGLGGLVGGGLMGSGLLGSTLGGLGSSIGSGLGIAGLGTELGAALGPLGMLGGALLGTGIGNLFKTNSTPIQDIQRALGQGKPVSDSSWAMAGFGPGGSLPSWASSSDPMANLKTGLQNWIQATGETGNAQPILDMIGKGAQMPQIASALQTLAKTTTSPGNEKYLNPLLAIANGTGGGVSLGAANPSIAPFGTANPVRPNLINTPIPVAQLPANYQGSMMRTPQFMALAGTKFPGLLG